MIGPLVRTDRDRVAALVIRAIDQDAAHAGGAHLGEGDFGRAGRGGHSPMIAPTGLEVKPLDIGPLPGWRATVHRLASASSAVCQELWPHAVERRASAARMFR